MTRLQNKPVQHTLLMSHIGHTTHATIYQHLLHTVKASFALPGVVSDTVMMLIARPDCPGR